MADYQNYIAPYNLGRSGINPFTGGGNFDMNSFFSMLPGLVARLRRPTMPNPQNIGSNQLQLPGNWQGVIHIDPMTGRASFGQPAF